MRILSRSVWRKVLATLIAVLGFVLLYEATTFDSRDASSSTTADPTRPVPGSRLQFAATAYCKGTTTASGVGVRTGIAAADPALLPVGSVINVTTDAAKYNGIYTIMDTGPRVQGRTLDVYMWSCNEALAFGRKDVQITILRLGWNPSASSPSLIDRLFRRRAAARLQPAQAPAPETVSVPDTSNPVTTAGSDAAAVPAAADREPHPVAPPDRPAVSSTPPVAPPAGAESPHP